MLTKDLARAHADRVVLISGASILRHDSAMRRVREALAGRLAGTFDEVAVHSPIPLVRRAARLLQDTKAQAVVALGGGSAVVTARAATILAAEGRDVRDLCTHRTDDGRLVSPRLEAPKLPQWIVPSTPTTAYAKAGAAVRDPETGERLALFDPKTRASGVYFDAVVAATAPAGVVRSSALNALAMSIDGLQSGIDDPLAEASLRHALLLLRQWLPRIGTTVTGEVGVRLMFAALLAGEASDHVGSGLAQPISHAAGPRSHVGNGIVEAMLLPHTMRFNREVTHRALLGLSAILCPSEDPTPERAVMAVEDLLRASGVPPLLRDVGLTRESLAGIADHVMDDWASTTVPRPATRDELVELLEGAW
jgi:alcohol dehydrogenase class IV